MYECAKPRMIGCYSQKSSNRSSAAGMTEKKKIIGKIPSGSPIAWEMREETEKSSILPNIVALCPGWALKQTRITGVRVESY